MWMCLVQTESGYLPQIGIVDGNETPLLPEIVASEMAREYRLCRERPIFDCRGDMMFGGKFIEDGLHSFEMIRIRDGQSDAEARHALELKAVRGLAVAQARLHTQSRSLFDQT
jgi:hypothetical protein